MIKVEKCFRRKKDSLRSHSKHNIMTYVVYGEKNWFILLFLEKSSSELSCSNISFFYHVDERKKRNNMKEWSLILRTPLHAGGSFQNLAIWIGHFYISLTVLELRKLSSQQELSQFIVSRHHNPGEVLCNKERLFCPPFSFYMFPRICTRTRSVREAELENRPWHRWI